MACVATLDDKDGDCFLLQHVVYRFPDVRINNDSSYVHLKHITRKCLHTGAESASDTLLKNTHCSLLFNICCWAFVSYFNIFWQLLLIILNITLFVTEARLGISTRNFLHYEQGVYLLLSLELQQNKNIVIRKWHFLHVRFIQHPYPGEIQVKCKCISKKNRLIALLIVSKIWLTLIKNSITRTMAISCIQEFTNREGDKRFFLT